MKQETRSIKELRRAVKPSKHRNIKVTVGGLKFDSLLEADRFAELQMMEKAGLIQELDYHIKLVIYVNGIRICSYECDSCYVRDGKQVYEDVKAVSRNKRGKLKHLTTPVFQLKRKLLKATQGTEVTLWPPLE